jgi:DNA (cytosine-5)-methyltransferase 1
VSDVFEVDPLAVTDGQPVGLLWASPDCKHFSKAKGGKPRSKKIRALAWVVIKWAKAVKPRVICLENVEEFQTWGPLLADGMPCPAPQGPTFQRWLAQLRNLGYAVETRELRACDYGAPTIRKRFFLVARCDGQPIVWPEKTHGAGLKPYRTAAECIDWSLPCPSIFERERPLAEATMRRIAHGIKRYVLEAARPFIVPIGYGDKEGQAPRTQDLGKPLTTVVGAKKHALVQAFLAKHYTGVVGSNLADPIGTVTSTDHHSLVTSHLAKLRGTSSSAGTDEPLHTVSAQGQHHAEVRALLLKYYGTDQDPNLREPLHTVTSKDRFGLVTVKGIDYVIADIGMRMLQPRELYRAQGFPYFASSRTIRVCLESLSSASTDARPAARCSFDGSTIGPSEPVAVRARIGFGRLDLALLSVGKCRSLVQRAGSQSSYPLPTGIANSVRSAAREQCSPALGTRTGRVDQRASAKGSTHRASGGKQASPSGAATQLHVVDAASTTDTAPADSRSTTSPAGQRIPPSASPWTTSFSFVADAIASFIQSETSKRCSFVVEVIAEDGYIIDRGHDGRTLPKDAQVRMCGNSVCPPLARALVAANYAERRAMREAA